MKVYILTLFLIFSCFGNKASETFDENSQKSISKKKALKVEQDLGFQKNDTTVIVLKKLKYKLLDIKLNDSSQRVLLIQKNNKTVSKIDLLTQDDYEGFSINWIKDIDNGFEISIELGKYYFERNFQFIHKESNFYLVSIETKSLQKNSDLITDRKVLDKPISVTDFDINNYIK